MSKDVNTLDKNTQILINYQILDEVLFPQKFLKSALPFFNLEKLSNGHIRNVPTIIGAHPLAVLRGAEIKGESSRSIIDSKLPLIGVEQLQVKPQAITLGVHETKQYEVNENYLDMLENTPIDERVFPQELLDNLRSVYEQRIANDNKLFIQAHSIIKSTGTHISIWTASFESTRLLKKVIESLVIEFYRKIQEFGIKPEEYTLQPALYNFDIGEILFGAEFSLPFMIRNMNYLIDLSLEEVAEFEIGFILSPLGKPDEKIDIDTLSD